MNITKILNVSLVLFFSALALGVSAKHANENVAERLNIINYQDLFNLEYAANPLVLPNGQDIIYERRSMDIMTDTKRRNLWMVSIDGARHLPLLSDADNHYNPALSKDGTQLAYLSNKGGSTQIYVRDIQSGSTTKVSDVQKSPSNIVFSPDGKQLAFVMFTPSKPDAMFSLPFKPDGAEWAEDAHYIEQSLFQRDGSGMKEPGNLHVYVVPSIGGTPRQITSGNHDYSGKLAWTQDNRQIIVSANTHEDFDFDVFNTDLLAVDIATGQKTVLTDTSGPENNPTISPNGKMIAFTGFEDQGTSSHITELYVMTIDGKDIKQLTPELDRSVANIQWRKNSKGIYFSFDNNGKKNVGYVNLAGKITEKTSALGGLSIGRPYTSGHFDVTDDGEIIYTHSYTDRPADLAVIDKRGKTTYLTDLNGDIFDHKRLNKPELMTVKSSVDDRELQAWIVKPPEFDETKKYPLILEIHGGPHTAYGPEFSTEVQMFAAAGYVVIYGNPRGSTSQGSEFANLIDKNYPSEDYDDLMDMVDGIIEKGYIDEENLFVTGGSGGGVLTAWIIGKTNRFKAAVVAKPVINWVSMIGTSDIYTFMARYWFTDLPWNDYEQYWQRSPLSLVGNVTTPTMVLTGELDVRTPMAESEQYYGALRLQGIESSLVRIQGAYHGIAAKPSNLARKIGYILAWFDKFNDNNQHSEE